MGPAAALKACRDAFAVLVNKGYYNQNYNVFEKDEGMLIPKYRTKEKSKDVSAYIPCEFCQGLFVSTDLWKHQKVCVNRKDLNAASWQACGTRSTSTCVELS